MSVRHDARGTGARTKRSILLARARRVSVEIRVLVVLDSTSDRVWENSAFPASEGRFSGVMVRFWVLSGCLDVRFGGFGVGRFRCVFELVFSGLLLDGIVGFEWSFFFRCVRVLYELMFWFLRVRGEIGLWIRRVFSGFCAIENCYGFNYDRLIYK